MARPLRIEYEDAFYHIIQRGLERRNIFKEETDKIKFLEYVKEGNEKYSAIVHAYCLMDNHYHMIIQTPKANLTKVMHYINASYVMYYNKRHRRVGPLYQGRYRSIIVEADEYMCHLSRYIHLNPLRAKLEKNPGEYRWSSYKYYEGKKSPAKWLETGFILSNFGKKQKESMKRYKSFVEEGTGREKEIDRYMQENTHKVIFLGSGEFFQEIYKKYIEEKEDEEMPVIKEIKKENELKREDVEKIVRSIISEEKELRKITIYILKKYTQKTLKEISNSYEGIGDTGISILCKRLDEKRKKDKRMDKVIKAIEKMCKVET